jgi:hypothetical protein
MEKKFEEDYKIERERNENEIHELDMQYQKRIMDQVDRFENAKRLYEIERSKRQRQRSKTVQERTQ